MADNKLVCPICGQPTRIYMGNARKDLLCGKHAEALKAGKIEVNDKGLFMDKETGKILNMGYVEPKKKNKKALLNVLRVAKKQNLVSYSVVVVIKNILIRNY